MSWADELYENEPELAPYNEKGAHLISALAKFFQLSGGLEGNWKGQAAGTHSPLWGTASGAKTGYAFDTIPVPIAKSDVPMAAILGSAPWPVAGAIEATGRIPLAMAAAKSQKALAQSPLAGDAAIGKTLQNAPGLAENAWNLGKEGIESLLQRFRGLAPEGIGMEPAMQAARPAEIGQYGSIVDRLLGKHQTYIPHIPQSYEEPLLIKTGAKTIEPIQRQLPDLFKTASPDVGVFKPMWDRMTGGKGDFMASTIRGQDTTIPHESLHWFTDLINEYLSKGERPWDISAAAKAGFGHSPEELNASAQNFLRNFGNIPAKPGGKMTYNDKFRSNWDYGNHDPFMRHELTAELANPQGLADRFNKPLVWAQKIKDEASERWPVLRDLWAQGENYIPENAYDIPVWNQRLLGTAGQGATQGTARWAE